jgi:hypothetical protein
MGLVGRATATRDHREGRSVLLALATHREARATATPETTERLVPIEKTPKDRRADPVREPDRIARHGRAIAHPRR